MRSALGACVIAVLNKANSLLLLRCPVWSVKLVGYTATIGFILGGLTLANSFDCSSDILENLCFSVFKCSFKNSLLLNKLQLESKRIDR